jgi:quercetin dioxygenase-like cupin family protein
MQQERLESKSPASHSQEASIMMQGRSAELDIEKELAELRGRPEWHTGIARKVLVRYPDFQVTLRLMKANTRIPEHHNPGRLCVQTVRGHIRMHADGRLFDLRQGKALVLDRAVTHDVEALEESAFLLTAVPPQDSVR